MGFFDPALITLVLAYEAFVYIAAQIMNGSRARWEDLTCAQAGRSDVRKVATQRALMDFHLAFATFVFINGWVTAFFGASCAIVLGTIAFGWSGELIPDQHWLVLTWGSLLFALSAFTQDSILRSYREESATMPGDAPFARFWPRIQEAKLADDPGA